jgi:hypothetical protein
MSGSIPSVGSDHVAPHPHRVELTGRLATLAFPDHCANCAAPTLARARVRKVFARQRRYGARRRNRYRGYRIDEARVPYCPACLAQDAREREPSVRLWRARLAEMAVAALPALPCLGFGIFLEYKVLRAAPGGESAPGWAHAIAFLFVAWGIGLLASAWYQSRRHMVPRQTSVTLAFDFSEDVAGLLDPGQRRIYAMREAAFAEAFTGLNRDRIWCPNPAAEQREKWIWIACAAFLVVGALVAMLLNR